jgi:NADH-ubiquinone oxidoreductase chain 4
LGGCGLLRVFPVLFIFGFRFGIVWVALSLVGGLFVSLFCLRQTDLESLISYSSVAHMSTVIGGIMTLSYLGVCRSVALMVAHGLCSSGLSYLSNIPYERFGRRSLLANNANSHLSRFSKTPKISFLKVPSVFTYETTGEGESPKEYY